MLEKIKKEFSVYNATLIAVSKTKPIADLKAVYAEGQRHFGENYVQELVEKQPQMPDDTIWHFIGHLQSNKVKYIAPFVSMIHAVDSFSLLKEINKQAAKNSRTIDVLLQLKINDEETKFGFDDAELLAFFQQKEYENLNNIRIVGLMGIATFTDDMQQVRQEFQHIKTIFNQIKNSYFVDNQYFKELSIGMSGDYEIALEEGATLVRIGSLIFGSR